MTNPILTFGVINVFMTSHSPVPHTQISFSLGSPAVCIHSPATPPGSASAWFPLGRLPAKVDNGKKKHTMMICA